MDLIVFNDDEAMSAAAAERIADAFAAKPAATVVFATGATPVGTYRHLAERVRRDRLDLSRLRVFQLDEYVGVASDDRRSLYGWMVEVVLDPLGIAADQVVRLPTDAADPAEAGRRYDQALAQAGGFDMAILGLGPNGHIGFNEPPAGPDEPTRVIDLTPESIESNARYWGGPEHVPARAITAGMRQLLAARQTLLLVSGAHKHDILHRTVEGPITDEVPSSHLRQSANVTILADRAAWDGKAKMERS